MASDESFAEATIGYDATSPGGREAAARLVPLLTTRSFATRPVPDRAGVEAAGALKNIVALGVGFAEGAGHGANWRATAAQNAGGEDGEMRCDVPADVLPLAAMAQRAREYQG